MEKNESRLRRGQLINSDDPKVIGIVIAIFIVLISTGKLIYNQFKDLILCERVTYGTTVEHNLYVIGSNVVYFSRTQCLEGPKNCCVEFSVTIRCSGTVHELCYL
jgi:hypothetical protein